MVTSTMAEILLHRNRIAECNTFEAFKAAQLQYLDSCVEKLRVEEEKLKEAAREFLGLPVE